MLNPAILNPMRVALVALGLLAAVRPDASAQAPDVRYLAPTSWTQPFLDHLDRAGLLPGLDPLTRPLTRTGVVAAIDQPRTDSGGMASAAWATMMEVRRELEPPAAGDSAGEVRWSLDGRIGVSAASDASRWITRPQGDTARAFPQASLEGALMLPHLALVTTPAVDNRLKYDTLYQGKQDRVIAGRNLSGYVLTSWRWFDAFFGTIPRNWGPPELEGLLVSPSPYSYEHLYLRFGPQKLRIEMIAAQLDPLVPWDSINTVDRWQVSHRLVAEPSSRFAFSLGETSIATGTGLPWRYLNPVQLGLLTQYDGAPQVNSLLSADARWQAARALRLFAQVLIDDIQIDRSSKGDSEPPAYGLTVGGSGGLAHGLLAWTASYTRVSNLAYRTPLNEQQVTMQGMGIARNWSDYDEATLHVTALLRPCLLVGGTLTAQRQGQGDMRLRYPPASAYADSLTFLTGVVEKIVQPGLEASWAPSPWIFLNGAVALRSASNAGHVSGASDDRLVWRLGVSIRHRLLGRID